MATRNVTYQFEWGFATYDRSTEADAIAQVEALGEYLDKFDVTLDERDAIDEGEVLMTVVEGELIISDPEGNA